VDIVIVPFITKLYLDTEKASSGWLMAQKPFWREHIIVAMSKFEQKSSG
jgi:hypothetical protein